MYIAEGVEVVEVLLRVAACISMRDRNEKKI